MLQPDYGVRPEKGRSSDQNGGYQISEEGNRIGLGFNLCVAPTRTICSMSYYFRTVVGDWSWTEVGQGADRNQTRVGLQIKRIVQSKAIEEEIRNNQIVLYRRE